MQESWNKSSALRTGVRSSSCRPRTEQSRDDRKVFRWRREWRCVLDTICNPSTHQQGTEPFGESMEFLRRGSDCAHSYSNDGRVTEIHDAGFVCIRSDDLVNSFCKIPPLRRGHPHPTYAHPQTVLPASLVSLARDYYRSFLQAILPILVRQNCLISIIQYSECLSIKMKDRR